MKTKLKKKYIYLNIVTTSDTKAKTITTQTAVEIKFY